MFLVHVGGGEGENKREIHPVKENEVPSRGVAASLPAVLAVVCGIELHNLE